MSHNNTKDTKFTPTCDRLRHRKQTLLDIDGSNMYRGLGWVSHVVGNMDRLFSDLKIVISCFV